MSSNERRDAHSTQTAHGLYANQTAQRRKHDPTSRSKRGSMHSKSCPRLRAGGRRQLGRRVAPGAHVGLHPPASGYLHTRAARVKPASRARCGHTQACVRQQQAGGRAGDAGSGRGCRPTTAGVQIEGPGRTAARRRKVEMSACGVASSVASTLVVPAMSSMTLAAPVGGGGVAGEVSTRAAHSHPGAACAAGGPPPWLGWLGRVSGRALRAPDSGFGMATRLSR